MTVAARSVKQLVTVEDLERLPPDYRCELIRGELRDMPPPPGDAHGNSSIRFSVACGHFIYENNLGECYSAETGFVIARNPDTVKAPDFAFVARSRVPRDISMRPLGLAPDLVLETRSPSDRLGMVQKKVDEWLEAGVRMVLELNLKTRVLTVYQPGKEVLKLGVEDVFEGGEVLPGFTLPIRKLFRDAD